MANLQYVEVEGTTFSFYQGGKFREYTTFVPETAKAVARKFVAEGRKFVKTKFKHVAHRRGVPIRAHIPKD